MQVQVKKWGNSLGIRIPKEVLQAASFYPDETLDIRVVDGTVVLEKTFKHKTLEERAAAYGGLLGLDGEGQWMTPMGKEVW